MFFLFGACQALHLVLLSLSPLCFRHLILTLNNPSPWTLPFVLTSVSGLGFGCFLISFQCFHPSLRIVYLCPHSLRSLLTLMFGSLLVSLSVLTFVIYHCSHHLSLVILRKKFPFNISTPGLLIGSISQYHDRPDKNKAASKRK